MALRRTEVPDGLKVSGRKPRRGRRGIALVAILAALVGGCVHDPSFPMHDLQVELNRVPAPAVRRVLAAPETYRVQILVSEVVDGPGGRLGLRRHGYRLGAEYFYPASSIKLCAAVAALQFVEGAGAGAGGEAEVEAWLDRPMEIAALFDGDVAQVGDPLSAEQPGAGSVPITLRREIRKLALVSDNVAFNRLFDVVGHEALNRSMHALGHRSVVINHRLSEIRAIPDPLASAAVRWPGAGGGDREIAVPARRSTLSLSNSAAGLRVGVAYLRGEERVPEPMDFTRRNGISLVDLQNLLVQVVRPDVELGLPRLALDPARRRLLVEAMTQYPRESADPRYEAGAYPDHYSKFLLPGIRRVVSSTVPGARVEVTGKIGRAYGFSVENAYVQEPRAGRGVFVTAVIYTNEDGVLNDDRYEYETVADPFLADLGEWVARCWLRLR
ncbi:MAG: serine hydrolase [Verrucomicrobiales bacterium]|nr:serine hydrolase [Verrucomicrobiales bacterium]